MSRVLAGAGKVAGIVASAALLVGAVATGNPALAAVTGKVAAIATASAAVASPAADRLYHRPRKPMTAISMFADKRRAYLVTDGAQFDSRDGRVVGFEPKVLMFSDVSMAIAFQGGYVSAEELCSAMAGICDQPTQPSFLTSLPGALALARMTSPMALANHTRLWVATFDPARRAPRLYTVQSGPMPDGDGAAWAIEETDGLVTGFSDLSEILPNGWPEHPVRDGLAILAAQRTAPFAAIGGAVGVGGECGLYSVSRTGVDYRALIRYPDKLGERADPAAPGVLA